VTSYHPLKLLIDRLMGFRAPSYIVGFSGKIHLTVTGPQIKKNYCTLGLDGKKIYVVGNPGYDHIVSLKDSFTVREKKSFRDDLNIPENRKLWSFFLSPSSFSEIQIKEVITVVKHIRSKVANSFFVIKFHPKTVVSDPPKFRKRLQFLGQDFLLLTEFEGDEFNAKLILISDLVVQKQCTVGWIAMLLQKPMISYNLFETNYYDDMYKVFDASIHVESVEELDLVLDQLNKDVLWTTLKEKQRRACELFCLPTDSANLKISKIISAICSGVSS